MNRRQTLKLLGATAIAGVAGLPNMAFAAAKEMVVVVKIAGIPWFNALEVGVKKAGGEFGINASMVGPSSVDPAQQVKLIEDLIAKKVDVIGLVPLDVKAGDRVLFGKWSGTEVKIDGQDLLIMKESDIMGVIA